MITISGNKLNREDLQSTGCLKVNIQILLVILTLRLLSTIRFCFTPSLLSVMSAAMTCSFDPGGLRMLPASKTCCASGVATPCCYQKWQLLMFHGCFCMKFSATAPKERSADILRSMCNTHGAVSGGMQSDLTSITYVVEEWRKLCKWWCKAISKAEIFTGGELKQYQTS